MVNGPPWRTTVGVLFTDRATSPGGEVVYENRVMFPVRAVWGTRPVPGDGLNATCIRRDVDLLSRR